MKLLKYSLFGASLLLGLASCEMKEELWGEEQNNGATGLLALALNVDDSTNKVNTKADSGDEEINQFPVIIYDSEGEVVRSYDSYSDVEELIELQVGNYSVEAHSPGEFLSQMSEPYFGGTEPLEIKEGRKSNAQVVCKMQNLPVKINYDATFLAAFTEWTITVSDGASNILTFTNENPTGSTIYWKLGENVTQITVHIEATTTSGESVSKTNYYTKENAEEDYTGDKPFFEGGDMLDIHFTQESSTAKPGVEIGIKVDITFADDNETTEIPVDDITDGGDDPNDDPNDDPKPNPGGITITDNGTNYLTNGITVSGTDYPDDVAVVMNVPNGIRNVYVKIKTSDDVFEGMVGDMGLTDGDGMDLTSSEASELAPLFPLPEAGVDKKEYTFLMSETLWGMLGAFAGTHDFILKVIDQEGNDASATLTITLTK